MKIRATPSYCQSLLAVIALLVLSIASISACQNRPSGPDLTAPPGTIPSIYIIEPTVVAGHTGLPATNPSLPATHTIAATDGGTKSVTDTLLPTASATPLPTALGPEATATATTYPFATLDMALPTPPTAVPTPVPPLVKPAYITNIVLLGNDVKWPQGGRTDSIMIVSINRETKTAAILSVPRDLYVYIPGWTMNRINLALPRGHGGNYPGGGGGLIKDTILYNFGLPVDYYVRIGFNGFIQAVDALGGIEVVTSCSLRDWRLITPELDPTVEENWELFTLEPGVHQMDGELALWYVRSRRSSNDFERGWRQQQVLRAMLQRGVSRDLLPQAPVLWNTFQDAIETDMSLALVLELAALAPAVRENGIQHLHLAGHTVHAWRVPISGEAVQLLQWEEAQAIFRQLLQPPVLNRAERLPITVEVTTSNVILYRQAAENLAWHGFVPVFSYRSEADPPRTTISYFGHNFKGSFNWLLAWTFNQDVSQIELITGEAVNGVNYRVSLGRDYNPCRPLLAAPRID